VRGEGGLGDGGPLPGTPQLVSEEKKKMEDWRLLRGDVRARLWGKGRKRNWREREKKEGKKMSFLGGVTCHKKKRGGKKKKKRGRPQPLQGGRMGAKGNKEKGGGKKSRPMGEKKTSNRGGGTL